MWRIRNVEPQRRVRLTMEFSMNSVEPILFQARHDPPAPAMCAPGTALGIVSYARLARFIHSVGHRAVRLGIAPGQIVAIHVSDHIFHAALALGFMHLGIVTVSIGATLPPNLHIDVVITDTPEVFGNGRRAKIVAVDLSWMSGKGVPVDDRHVYRGNGNDLCRIALTSGSTGEPRAVGFTHNNQLARLARYNHVFGNLFPQTLQTFALYKVQGLIASPGGLSGFLTFYDTNRDFPCSFDIILSAGSPLPDPLSQQVRSRMCSNQIFYYGTTETSTIASAPAHALTALAGAVVYVTPDVSVQIVDDTGGSVPANREGVVRVRTPVNVNRYLDDPDQTKTAFRDGYFDTGDIGYLTNENMLVISGRKKEILNLGGDKISPRMIEDALRTFYGIRDAAAFSVANGARHRRGLGTRDAERPAERRSLAKALPREARADASSRTVHQRRGHSAQREWQGRSRSIERDGGGVYGVEGLSGGHCSSPRKRGPSSVIRLAGFPLTRE